MELQKELQKDVFKNRKKLVSELWPQERALVVYPLPLPKLSVCAEMLKDFLDWQNVLIANLAQWERDFSFHQQPVHYVGLGGLIPSVFSLGGDLELFLQLVETKNREALTAYAHQCVENVWNWYQGFHQKSLTTFAMIEGTALGGGLEAALACDIVFVEEGVRLGLPEVNFNLFPGMGALPLLTERVGPRLAEKLIIDAKIHRAEELFEMGAIDFLVPKGKMKAHVRAFLQEDQKNRRGRQALRYSRRMTTKLSHQDLIKVTDHWVTKVFELEQKDQGIIQTLVRAQKKKIQKIERQAQLAVWLKKTRLDLKKPLAFHQLRQFVKTDCKN